jgi:hypothetical protein
VYDLYQPLPELEALKRTWLPMLKLLRRFTGVQLYTTNYDLVIEEALSQLGVADTGVDTGWRGSTKRTLDTQLWGTRPDFTKPLLTKLHGSVNWSWVRDEIHISDPAYKGDHKRHPILYPGFKGRPAQEPFSLFHRHLQHALRDADLVIVIGFAFRDEHINQLFIDEVGPRTAVYVIDVRAPVRAPLSGDRFEVLGEGEGFTDSVVRELSDRLDSTTRRRTTVTA